MLERILEILKENGIEELRPPQKKVLERGLLDKGKNFLISIPTASGKTLIGEIALLNHLLEDRDKKGLFIVPLKALASEKYEEFKRKYERYGIKV
ncbi:MAG TPA: DEAD/DEAH box helicase, partial [Methanothermococcus okinawensis]|nr:DEAD/DEAH box helicase [Methanothermococcus okinawensis]